MVYASFGKNHSMKILDVSESISMIVETDNPDFPTYRRFPSGTWEQLMGDSWEPVYFDEDKLEKLYKEWLVADEHIC